MQQNITFYQVNREAVAQWIVRCSDQGGTGSNPHCSQHVVVSLGKTLHPKLLLWGLPRVLSM